jgi:uncharacterized protein YkwD
MARILVIALITFAAKVASAQIEALSDELELLRLTNELRTDPQRFLQQVVRPYFISQKADTVGNEYRSSLLAELNVQAAGPALKREALLDKKAREFAKDMGQRGATGHESEKLGSFSERLKELKYKYLAENCSYGYKKAIDILMQLLVDDGVTSRGHRKNLLNPIYTNIGIAIEPHRVWTWNCVMDFSN